MNESEFQLAKIKALLEAYVQLTKMSCEPGQKAHFFWNAYDFIKRQLKEALK